MNRGKNEFKSFDSIKYGILGKALGPDYNIHHIAHDLDSFRYGYIYSQKHSEDCSFYSPYLIYVLGKKIGIDVPEVELGILYSPQIQKEGLYETSIVYENGYGLYPGYNQKLARIEEDVIYSIFAQENSERAFELRKESTGKNKKMTVDEYIESMIYFLTSRGDKPQDEYSKNDIEDIKQELITRIMFGLRLGISGKTSVTMQDYKNATLDPYMLSSRDIYKFSEKDNCFNEMLSIDDKYFGEMLEEDFSPQYGVPPNKNNIDTAEFLSYLFLKYPKQAKKGYEKTRKISKDVLKKELNNFTRMSQVKKDFALKAFEIRQQALEKTYKNYLKEQEQIR